MENRIDEGGCPVIVAGIGAPADACAALKGIFTGMSSGRGVAFVIVQHIEPSEAGLDAGWMRAQTELAVVEATEGMPVLADRIHIMPRGKFLDIAGSRFTFHEPPHCNGLQMPIDHFFCSLAHDQRRRACAVLLSGTNSDGILGLSEVKAAGGRILMEVSPNAEVADRMQSTIDASVVDVFLPADAMAEAIVDFAAQVRDETSNEATESPDFDANLMAILDTLRTKGGHDFRCYKPSTLVRRIRRRMMLAKIPTFAAYARFMEEHPNEAELLQKDLLIGVTEFFRQPEAWEILEQRVVSPLIGDIRPGSELRVWTPGCSTGQEAYSLAMLLTEQVEKSGKQINIQVFATDSDAAALATARSGGYSLEEIGENISSERLERFFEHKDGRFRIVKSIRERIVFAPQNLMTDPPFSRLDLIICRNLMIYLHQEVQRKIIALFHFSLREGGFLFLGSAETIGDREDLFEPVSKKWRIYRRIGIGRRVNVEIPVHSSGETQRFKPAAFSSTPKLSLASTAQQMLLERFAPACVMIDRKLQVLYVHGAVEGYLTIPPGEITTKIVYMAREGLRARLRVAIGKAVESNRPVSATARVRRGEKSIPVKATAIPLRYPPRRPTGF